MNKQWLRTLTLTALLLGGWPQVSSAFEITFSWSGSVDSIFLWTPDALPGNIARGDRVEGVYRFEAFDYSSESYINGTQGAGNKYRYQENLFQSIFINDQAWIVDSGTLTLMNNNRGLIRNRAIDFLSRNEDGGNVASYPNLFNDRAMGVAFFDDVLAFDLFSSIDIRRTAFNDTEFTGGSGRVVSRNRNANGDFVDGYYISLAIDQLSIDISPLVIEPPILTPIPLPGNLGLMLVGLCIAGWVRRRHL